MKRLNYFSIVLCFIFLNLILATKAEALIATPPYMSFGGIVNSYVLNVTCIGAGKLITIVSFNSLTSSILPIYVVNPLKIPRLGARILGSASMYPSFTTCFTNTTTPVPVPVRITTLNYGISK
jgi:hypothetical protein